MNEALRLADALEQQFPIGTAQHYLDGEAAAKLRRLHALNAELVEALRGIVEFVDRPVEGQRPDVWAKRVNQARAALAKVEASNG